MVNLKKIKRVTMASAMAALMAGSSGIFPRAVQGSESGSAASGTISPDSYSASVNQDESVTLERTIRVNVDDTVETEIITTPGKLDVLFLADNTGSMGPAIENVQQQASALLNDLDDTYGDVEIGVARYFGNPDEYWDQTRSVPTGTYSNYETTGTYDKASGKYFGRKVYRYKFRERKNGRSISTYKLWMSSSFHKKYRSKGFRSSRRVADMKTVVTKSRAENAYELQEQVNGGSRQDALAAINSWVAQGGGDHPEGNLFALHQAATSGARIGRDETDYITNWRPDAKRLIVWFGDAQAHTSVATPADAINALNENDVSVIGINVFTNSNSISNGINYDSQASSIAEATGGIFQNSSTSSLTEKIGDLIEEVATEVTTTTAGSIDLNFSSQGDTDGLDIVYTCTDPLGCDDVKDGESRTFEMTITGERVGNYSFNTIVAGVDGAIASNSISVVSPIVGNPPDVVNDEADTFGGNAISIPVLDNDTDPDGGVLRIQSYTQGANGTVVITSDEKVVYTPNQDAPLEGSDTFSYTAVDVDGNVGTATVKVDLNGYLPD